MITKDKLFNILETNESRQGRIFDLVVQIIIIISLLAFAIDTLPNNPPKLSRALGIIEITSLIAFTTEYILRIYVSKNIKNYIFSFYGIIDFFAIAPFILSMGVDLRALRALRIIRAFRALKLVRYERALKRIGIAFRLIKEELYLFLIVTGILIFIVASGIYIFENEAQPEVYSSIFHSMWWSVVTLTTVGYGDVYPITVGGRAFTFFVLIIGVGIVTIPAGLVASAFQKARQIEDESHENK